MASVVGLLLPLQQGWGLRGFRARRQSVVLMLLPSSPRCTSIVSVPLPPLPLLLPPRRKTLPTSLKPLMLPQTPRILWLLTFQRRWHRCPSHHHSPLPGLGVVAVVVVVVLGIPRWLLRFPSYRGELLMLCRGVEAVSRVPLAPTRLLLHRQPQLRHAQTV